MLMHKGASKNSTMSGNSEIPQIGIPGIPAKKHALKSEILKFIGDFFVDNFLDPRHNQTLIT